MRLFERLHPDTLRDICGLSIGELADGPFSTDAPGTGLPACGWDAIARPRDEVEPLREAVNALHRAGLPVLAVYAFDAMWRAGFALRDGVSARVGARYELLEDFWAFRVEPGTSGWAPHRGTDAPLERARPEILNVWLALSDAAVNQSCMHLVAVDDDAAYLRGDLTDHAAAATRGCAAPCAAGTALYWNANALHWGGLCSTDAPGPRVSVTFTLARADTVHAGASFRAEELDPWQRLDALARQVLTYAETANVDRELLDWARTTDGLHRKLRRRG